MRSNAAPAVVFIHFEGVLHSSLLEEVIVWVLARFSNGRRVPQGKEVTLVTSQETSVYVKAFKFTCLPIVEIILKKTLFPK